IASLSPEIGLLYEAARALAEMREEANKHYDNLFAHNQEIVAALTERATQAESALAGAKADAERYQVLKARAQPYQYHGPGASDREPSYWRINSLDAATTFDEAVDRLRAAAREAAKGGGREG